MSPQDGLPHWPSEFKLEGHPNLIVDGVDTRTGLLNQPDPWRLGGNWGPHKVPSLLSPSSIDEEEWERSLELARKISEARAQAAEIQRFAGF